MIIKNNTNRSIVGLTSGINLKQSVYIMVT